MMHTIGTFIKEHPFLTLALLNMLSFCVIRVYWHATKQTGAKLEVVEPAKDGEKMYYLVAGCVNQPEPAFDFLLDELDGGITYVNYDPVRGCNIATIAEQVIADAKRHSYQPRVIGISIGDYVARQVEDAIPGAKSVGINPEPKSSILRPWANLSTKVGSIIAEAASTALGWLSIIPWYNGCGNRFSLAFIADQFQDIGFTYNTPHTTTGTVGVIISERPGKAEGDEFLENSSIKEYFDGVQIVEAKASHGNTVDMADKYLEAWKKLDLSDF